MTPAPKPQPTPEATPKPAAEPRPIKVEKLRTAHGDPTDAAATATPKPSDEPLDTDDLAAVWKRVTAAAPSMMIRTLLEHARLASVAAGVARVVVAPGMRSLAEGRKGELEQLLSRHGGVQARIEHEDAAAPRDSSAAEQDGSRDSDEPRLPPGADDRVREHPLVKETARVFGAGIAKVKPRPIAAKPPADDRPQNEPSDEAHDATGQDDAGA